jgi:uncharacterized protein
MRLQSQDMYENGIWDILLCFFIGMALYKSGYLVGNKSNAFYASVAVIGISLGIAINYFHLRQQYQLKFDNFQLIQNVKFSYYEIRRVSQTLGYLSLLILIYKITPFKKILNVFAPVGQMAFTNYLSQSIFTSIIFYGFGLFATLQRYEIYYVVVAIWLFQIVTSHIWLRYFRFGPFEWVWRSLTYLKKQPMKRWVVTAEAEGVSEEITPTPALA